MWDDRVSLPKNRQALQDMDEDEDEISTWQVYMIEYAENDEHVQNH